MYSSEKIKICVHFCSFYIERTLWAALCTRFRLLLSILTLHFEWKTKKRFYLSNIWLIGPVLNANGYKNYFKNFENSATPRHLYPHSYWHTLECLIWLKYLKNQNYKKLQGVHKGGPQEGSTRGPQGGGPLGGPLIVYTRFNDIS